MEITEIATYLLFAFLGAGLYMWGYHSAWKQWRQTQEFKKSAEPSPPIALEDRAVMEADIEKAKELRRQMDDLMAYTGRGKDGKA